MTHGRRRRAVQTSQDNLETQKWIRDLQSSTVNVNQLCKGDKILKKEKKVMNLREKLESEIAVT